MHTSPPRAMVVVLEQAVLSKFSAEIRPTVRSASGVVGSNLEDGILNEHIKCKKPLYNDHEPKNISSPDFPT